MLTFIERKYRALTLRLAIYDSAGDNQHDFAIQDNICGDDVRIHGQSGFKTGFKAIWKQWIQFHGRLSIK